MATLLITGGAGFIGSNLVEHALRHTAADIVVVDKLTYAAHPLALDRLAGNPRVTFIQADIADAGNVGGIVRRARPSAILNLAAETHVDRSIDSPRAFVDTNLTGTFVLLDAAREYIATLPVSDRAAFRFLHVSTDEVFGTLGATGSFTEQSVYAPNSPYAATKAGADHLVRAYFHTFGLPTLITNCSNNYGPFQHPEKLVPLMILNALDARPLPIYGDGRHVRDWLYVEDHCAAILRVLAGGRPGEQYNIGTANEQTNAAMVGAICGTLEDLYPARANPAMRAAGLSRYDDLKQFVRDRPGHDRRYAIDATKLRQELGWTPRHTFAHGLRATVAWYLEHREHYDARRVGYDRQRLGLSGARAT